MKVIFLDVDGNLNDVATKTFHMCEGQRYDGVDKEKIILLRKIVKETGLSRSTVYRILSNTL